MITKFSLDAQEKARNHPQSRIFNKRDYSYLHLKPNHASRPIWMDPDGIIILESFSPLAPRAQEFLTTIGEPLSRPQYLHEYRITAHSLHAAVASAGLTAQDLISTLERFSKIAVPNDIANFIKTCTDAYGKVKLVLKDNKYFIECKETSMLQKLIQDPEISQGRVQDSVVVAKAPQMGGLVIPGTKEAAGVAQAPTRPGAVRKDPAEADKNKVDGKDAPEDVFAAITGITEDGEGDEEEEEEDTVHSFEISRDYVEVAQKRCWTLGYPISEEYAFRDDTINPTLPIDLRPHARIRPYQEVSLNKMFGNGRAKSGIIVLPCGAGKTLVGISAACTIKKSVVVLATSA